MDGQSDAALLREYSMRGKDAAFTEIVTRHADLVYASALRQVNSPELARDIAQTVFTDRARKAPISRHLFGPGWDAFEWGLV
jgi:DNA-directed RNA polymerase specialized sigma24 family protein